jgi:hypothetical protein
VPKAAKARCPGLFSHGRIAFTLHTQQLIKPLADRRRQPLIDVGVKALLMRTQRCAGNALYPVGSRRFNRQFTTARFQSPRPSLAISPPASAAT